MDELITEFLLCTNSPEYNNEVYRSFKLCNQFEYPNVYSPFIEILANESYASNDQLQDQFDFQLHVTLNEILKQHNLQLSNEATLIQKNDIIEALYTIQGLEDYSAIETVLNTLDTDEVKLAIILEDYCSLDRTEILSVIEFFNPVTLELLKVFINDKQKSIEDNSVEKSLIPTFKLFIQLYGRDNIGALLINNGIKLGYDLNLYLGYIDNIQAQTDSQTAVNVMSLIYMTPESLNGPLTIFNQYSLNMLHDLTLVGRIEPLVIRIINEVNEYIEANKLKASL